MSIEEQDNIETVEIKGSEEKSKEEIKEQIDFKKDLPMLIIHDDFDECENNLLLFESRGGNVPVQFFPKIFEDNRGYFSESLVSSARDYMMPDALFLSDIIQNTKQVNRSGSIPGVFRGFHAQKAPYNQGKLVECLSNTPIFDIIIDARPQSKSFRQFRMFKLSLENMSKVWVPRGFLHGIFIPKYEIINFETNEAAVFEEKAQLQYFCDNEYDKDSEITINPESVLPYIINTYVEEYKKNPDQNKKLVGFLKTFSEGMIYSEKDKTGLDFLQFTSEIEEDYKKTGNLWYAKQKA